MSIILDGRKTAAEYKSKGYYIGPIIIDNVTPDMDIAQDEIFGPVLCIIHAKNKEDAIKIQNNSPYGNGAAVFTQNGALVNEVINGLTAGMAGVNIGVPVPAEPFSFGGTKESKFGACDITSEASINFWTEYKKVTTRWAPAE